MNNNLSFLEKKREKCTVTVKGFKNAFNMWIKQSIKSEHTCTEKLLRLLINY